MKKIMQKYVLNFRILCYNSCWYQRGIMNFKGIVKIENNEKKEKFASLININKDLTKASCNGFEIIYDDKTKRLIKNEYKKSLIRIDIENENMSIKDKDIELEFKIKILNFKKTEKEINLEYSLDKEKIKINVKVLKDGIYE